MEAELQAERAAAEAEADRVKAAIEEKRREREEVEAALRIAVRASCRVRRQCPSQTGAMRRSRILLRASLKAMLLTS